MKAVPEASAGGTRRNPKEGSVANLRGRRRDGFDWTGRARVGLQGTSLRGVRSLSRAVRWYCRYGVSYRDLEQMMSERGVSVDHSTIYRWVQKYAPEIEKRLRWQWRQPTSTSWRVDETYIKVRGQWTYLYRAVDKFGNTIDFYLSPTRNTAAAKRFLGKALNGLKDWEKPTVINTDKALYRPRFMRHLWAAYAAIATAESCCCLTSAGGRYSSLWMSQVVL